MVRENPHRYTYKYGKHGFVLCEETSDPFFNAVLPICSNQKKKKESKNEKEEKEKEENLVYYQWVRQF